MNSKNITEKEKIIKDVEEWVRGWNSITPPVRKKLNHHIVASRCVNPSMLSIYEEGNGIIVYSENMIEPVFRIVYVLINPQKTNMNIGDRLLEKLINVAKRNNITEIRWNISIQDSGFLPWAEKWGFKRHKTVKTNNAEYIECSLQI